VDRPSEENGEPSTGASVQRFLVDGGTIVSVAGDISGQERPLIRCLAEELSSCPAQLIVDLSEVTHVDAAGIEILVTAAANAGEADIAFCIAGLHGGVKDAFDSSGVLEMFEIFPTVNDARRGCA
jgi:anti-sigma B factor antagonist